MKILTWFLSVILLAAIAAGCGRGSQSGVEDLSKEVGPDYQMKMVDDNDTGQPSGGQP